MFQTPPFIETPPVMAQGNAWEKVYERKATMVRKVPDLGRVEAVRAI